MFEFFTLNHVSVPNMKLERSYLQYKYGSDFALGTSPKQYSEGIFGRAQPGNIFHTRLSLLTFSSCLSSSSSQASNLAALPTFSQFA